MSESLPPIAILWLVGGLVAGTTGGYFWGVDSQLILDTPQQHSTSQASQNTQQPIASSTTAAPNPTGLNLVGTVVQADHSKSMAWLLQVGSDTTQRYKEGDALPGGYQLIAIGADDLQVSKDGNNFVIHRISPSSGQNNNIPCQSIAQNSHGFDADASEDSRNEERAARPSGNAGGRAGGLASRRHRDPAVNQARTQGMQNVQGAQGPQTSQDSQTSQRSLKPFKGWGSKTTLGDDAILESPNNDVLQESPDDKDNATDTTR